jgi:putative oxidoreductase
MSISTLSEKVATKMEGKKDLILFLIRISLGLVFFQAGLGKLMNFERTIGFFASLGIPMVTVNTALAVATEFLGGILLILGLGTRLVSLPLAFVMVVAILTAHMGDVDSLVSFLGLQPWDYMLTFLLLAAIGGGKYSLDQKLFGKS